MRVRSHRLTAALVPAAFWALSIIPRPLVLPLSDAVGFLVYKIWRRRRRIAMRNLDIAFRDSKSQTQKKFLAQRTFQHAARHVLILPRQKRWLATRKYECKFTISAEDDALLNECSKSPTALLASHVGDWELNHFYLWQRQLDIVVVARDIPDPHLNDVVNNLRGSRGAGVVSKTGALGKLRETLRQGRSIGILADQNDPKRENFYEFFGVPASTYTEFARLLVRARCRVVFTACIRESSWRYRILARELRPRDDSNARHTAASVRQQADRLIRRYLQVTEELARADPDQYFWLHRRWKSRPTFAPWLYHHLGEPLRLGLLDELTASETPGEP